LKKTTIGAIGLLVIGLLYYFTSGSTQLVEEMKKQVNHELTMLQQNGFTIEERETKETQEHFVLNFSEPAKISAYLQTQGVHAKTEELAKFKGLRLGVDATYLNDTYSALSVDIYPQTLSDAMLSSVNQEDKKLLEHIQTMLKNKALLVHMDFNKLLTGFKGYIKDINETITEEVTMNLLAQGMTFEGNIEDEKFKGLNQKIKLLSFSANNGKLAYTLSNTEWEYAITGASVYDTHSKYQIEAFRSVADDLYSVDILNVKGASTTLVENKLLKSSATNSIEKIVIREKQKAYVLSETTLNAEVNNLDMDAFQKLQRVDPEDHEAVNKLSQQILSKGVAFKLNKLSSKEVTADAKPLGGFEVTASGNIDKTFDLSMLKQNPLAFLTAVNTEAHIALSPTLFSLVMQNPKAMLALMLFPPQEKNGQKVYDLSYIKGKLTVNGVSF
jgi:hypothetical protein